MPDDKGPINISKELEGFSDDLLNDIRAAAQQEEQRQEKQEQKEAKQEAREGSKKTYLIAGIVGGVLLLIIAYFVMFGGGAPPPPGPQGPSFSDRQVPTVTPSVRPQTLPSGPRPRPSIPMNPNSSQSQTGYNNDAAADQPM